MPKSSRLLSFLEELANYMCPLTLDF